MTDNRLVRTAYERALTFLRAGDGAMTEQYAKGHEELGRALQQMGRVGDAVGHLRQAVALDPKLQSAQAFLRTDPSRELLARGGN